MTPEEIAAVFSRPATDVPTAGRILGVSVLHAYRCARNGQIPTVKLGRKLIVPTAALAEMLKMPASAA